MNEKLKELLSDDAFVKELLNESEPAAVQAKLSAKGVDISIDELNAVAEEIGKAIERGSVEESAELSEDDLEQVAGGAVDPKTVFTAVFGTIGLALMTWDAVERRW